MVDKTKEREGWSKIARWASRRSLWIVHFCTGCGAIELPPVMTSRYDVERFGMGPMATPRQADVLLITGYLSIKTLKRVVRVYEQMQAPKYVVGFGSCTLNGGMYWDSYNTIKDLSKYIPVDIYIGGCMPRPEAVIDSFLKLMKMIDNSETMGWKRYEKYHEQYKRNQDAVFNYRLNEIEEIDEKEES